MAGVGATAKQIAAIIAQVTIAMYQARVGSGETTQYVQHPYKADINTGTHDGLKLYPKAAEAKEKAEDQLKLSQSNSKAVVTCMKEVTEKFGWSAITSKIDDPKEPGKNLANIFTSMSLLKLEHVRKKAYKYWAPANGNDCPDVLRISDFDPDTQVNDRPLLFARVCIKMIAKGIQAHISKASFQYLLLEKKHFEWAGANEDQKWDGLVTLWLIWKKINPTTQVGISNLKDAIEQATLQKSSNNVFKMLNRMQQNFEDIKDRGSTHDDYLCHIFRALMTSTNMLFRDFIQQEKDKWETEGTTTSDE